MIHQKDNIQENKMGRVQIGKKQRVEVSDYDESTKQIAKKVLREIVNEGFNGADVLPGVWVIEKTLRNHIVAEQPNIAPEISINEVNELAETILESVKAQTIKGDEKVKSTEDYENSQNFPKELPTIKMGNVSVVKFPEGGQDAERSIKVDGYRKVGRFYRPKLDVEELKLRKSRNKKARKELIFEQKENLRRIKLRRGLLKPVTTKSTLGKPINLVKSPEGLLPMPIPQFDLDTRKINILDNEKIQKALAQVKSTVKRVEPVRVEPVGLGIKAAIKDRQEQRKIRKKDNEDRDNKFIKKIGPFLNPLSPFRMFRPRN